MRRVNSLRVSPHSGGHYVLAGGGAQVVLYPHRRRWVAVFDPGAGRLELDIQLFGCGPLGPLLLALDGDDESPPAHPAALLDFLAESAASEGATRVLEVLTAAMNAPPALLPAPD